MYSSRMRYCTQCQRERTVTDKSRLLTRGGTKRWQCEWCAAKVINPKQPKEQRNGRAQVG